MLPTLSRLNTLRSTVASLAGSSRCASHDGRTSQRGMRAQPCTQRRGRAAQGIPTFCSSGDDGASDDDPDDNSGRNVDYPASSPFAFGCGGTKITLNDIKTEVAWDHAGGGISTVYKVPKWQARPTPVLRQNGRVGCACHLPAETDAKTKNKEGCPLQTMCIVCSAEVKSLAYRDASTPHTLSLMRLMHACVGCTQCCSPARTTYSDEMPPPVKCTSRQVKRMWPFSCLR